MQAFLFQSAQHLYEKREGYGSIPLTNGSGSGKPKNIRIPNTAEKTMNPKVNLPDEAVAAAAAAVGTALLCNRHRGGAPPLATASLATGQKWTSPS